MSEKMYTTVRVPKLDWPPNHLIVHIGIELAVDLYGPFATDRDISVAISGLFPHLSARSVERILGEMRQHGTLS